ncbi:unnamed protein product [Urochloa humidicola]
METEQRSLRRWPRLQRMAASKDLLAGRIAPWERVELAGGDNLEGREPQVKGWRWLKGTLVFSGQANNKTVKYIPSPLRIIF